MRDKNLKLLHNFLIDSGKTIAAAESCSGGLLSCLLTSEPGSSAYFLLGLVTYSNSAKTKLLRVPRSILSQKGAVSTETAKLMSQSVRRIAQSDIGLGITGIAGPSGGSAQKPVGTVFISVSTRNKTACRRFLFAGSRQAVREQAVCKAIEMAIQAAGA